MDDMRDSFEENIEEDEIDPLTVDPLVVDDALLVGDELADEDEDEDDLLDQFGMHRVDEEEPEL